MSRGGRKALRETGKGLWNTAPSSQGGPKHAPWVWPFKPAKSTPDIGGRANREYRCVKGKEKKIPANMIKCDENTASCGSSKISGDTTQRAHKSSSGGNEAHLIIFKKETSRTTLKASPRLFPKKNQSSLNAKQTGTGRFQSE